MLGQRLAETIAWCEARARPTWPKLSLRSPELDPRLPEAPGTDAEWHAAVESVARARSRIVGRVPRVRRLDPGRLVTFEYGRCTAMGAMAVETDRYFDNVDLPPWDTWVAFVARPRFPGWLISYVPAAFLELVECGIGVDADYATEWADAIDEPAVRAAVRLNR